MAIIPVVLNTDLLQFPEMFQAFMNEDNISWLGKDLRMKLKKTFHNSDLIFCIDEYDERLVAIKYQPTEKPLYIFSSIKVKSFISISSKLSDEHKNQIANLNIATYHTNEAEILHLIKKYSLNVLGSIKNNVT